LLGRRRGVQLVIAALAISLIILSTQAYVYHLSRREMRSEHTTLTDYILSMEQGSRRVAVASLINVSNGGASSNFQSNLDRWEAFVARDYQYGLLSINGTLNTDPPYSQGIRLDWGTNGTGISSTSADFNLQLTGGSVEGSWDFSVNISTTISLSGYYTTASGDPDNKTFHINAQLSNEEQPALAQHINISYNTTQWMNASDSTSYFETDYHNGTYQYTFNEIIPGATIPIRAQAHDRRRIYVQTEIQVSERS
jgi:hypothetical protein